MTTPLEVARSRYRTQQTLARRAGLLARRTWLSLDRSDLSGSWERRIGPLLTGLTLLQREAASGAPAYHRRAIAAQGGRVDFDGELNPDALSGYAADGRPLDSLLYLPVIEAKRLMRADIYTDGDVTKMDPGLPVADAMRRAGASFVTMVAQQVRDAGRVADGLANYANAHTTGYYRMLQTPSCARCAILAGKHFRKNQGFQRHPHCDCVHIPVVEADDSLAFDPRKAIESGQVTGLSERERQAILDGSDPSQVVNARRGMDPAGLYTTEGTTRRGVAGARMLAEDPRTIAGSTYQRTQRLRDGRTTTQTVRLRRARTPRPTPEAIYKYAVNRDEALGLLKRFGYIL